MKYFRIPSVEGLKARTKAMRFSFTSGKDYLKAYAQDTDRRVEADPSTASGMPEEQIVPYVTAYTTALGLNQESRLLDFGCGTLRTGKHFIRKLPTSSYHGVDISPLAISHSLEIVENDESLSSKKPTLCVIDPLQPLELPFKPNFILCHSVFTHLDPSSASGVFRQIAWVMEPGCTLAMTAFIDSKSKRKTYKSFWYTIGDLQSLAWASGIRLSFVPGRWTPNQALFVGSLH